MPRRSWRIAISGPAGEIRGGTPLLDTIYAGQSFRAVLRDLRLTSNQGWGWLRPTGMVGERLEAALTATRRDELQHGTNAAYVAGCICKRMPGAPAAADGREPVIIHTGKGTTYITTASTHLYQGRSWYVWNNTGDKVILRLADGSLKDTCSYPGEGASKYYC
jgi:hypothetical protein